MLYILKILKISRRLLYLKKGFFIFIFSPIFVFASPCERIFSNLEQVKEIEFPHFHRKTWKVHCI